MRRFNPVPCVGDVVEVRDLGRGFDGDYRVTERRHCSNLHHREISFEQKPGARGPLPKNASNDSLASAVTEEHVVTLLLELV